MRGCCSPSAFFPDNFHNILRSRHAVVKKIRAFFDSRGYLEVETPVRVRSPGIDQYIDAIACESNFFLAPSPELQMKRLLSCGMKRIYQISRVFRADESGRHHSEEFSMLEWYRAGTDYNGIMDEAEQLIREVVDTAGTSRHFPFQRVRLDDLYEQQAGWIPSREWDEDRYFRDWATVIEPFLSSVPGIFISDFPAALAALSRLHRAKPETCERFEIFMDGIEIGNAYTELTDYDEHVRRFEEANRKRSSMGRRAYPADENFLQSVRSGIPDCGGIAVGVDRLVMAVLGIGTIDEVQTFPASRL